MGLRGPQKIFLLPIFFGGPTSFIPEIMISVEDTLTAYTTAYTVRMAILLRTQLFFKALIASRKTKTEAASALKARDDFVGSKISTRDLKRMFGNDTIGDALKNSMKKCLKLAEESLSLDANANLDPCCVCLERGANYYIVHNGSAHKCVCAVCAMDLSLRPKPRCPISREEVWLMMKSAKESYECVCSQPNCERLLVAEQFDVKCKNKKTVTRFRPLVECHMCTMECLHADCCRVFSLY